MSPEVLIYIQNVKDYFKKSKETRDYFIGKKDEDIEYMIAYNIGDNIENPFFGSSMQIKIAKIL